MTRKPPVLRRAISGGAALTLVAGLVTMATPAFGAEQSGSAEPPTTEYLADSSAAQQRWLSVPDSRIVLNPFDSGGSGSELDQTAGSALPLHLGYYANDKAIHRTQFLQTYATSGEQDEGASRDVAFSDAFDRLDGWTESSVSAAASGGIATVSLNEDAQWGHIERRVQIDDITAARYLTVDVAELGGGASWNIKLNSAGGGDDLPQLQPDSSETGEVTFDLAQAYGWESGPKEFTLKIYVINKSDAGGGSVGVRALSMHNGADEPWVGEQVALEDDFADAAAWSTAESSGYSASMSSDGAQGTVHLGDDGFGAVERSVVVDLDATPLLSLIVAETTDEWALKLSTGEGADITVQPDSSLTGVFTYNLAEAIGDTGEQAMTIKLFHVGAQGTTTFDALTLHSGQPWLLAADSTSNTWFPEALESTGTYADGEISAVDAFHEATSFSRTIDVTTNGAAFAGTYQGDAAWDSTSHVLVVTDDYYTYALAFPEGTKPRFAPSIAGISTGQGAEAPLPGGGAWALALPDGTEHATVGVGLSVNDAAVTDDPAAAAQERAVAASSDPVGDRSQWASFWNAYLKKIPQVQDFSIQRVDDGGVTSDQMRRTWFEAWINLEMNVLPATPETGNAYAQLGTGKPSLWMNGTPGTKNVASWDSLLGMQQLVYTDPENAWASFQGMMALVEDSPDATEPSLEEYGTLGELGGESLPSRKAQTAWVLYSVTGDRAKLESIYDSLALHLNWERYNMRWVLGENNHFDERDSEFVTSLAFDLEYAIKIANELGYQDDATRYQSVISDISAKYTEWFFPTAADANGKVWDTVQKVYLDASREEVPFGDDTEGEPYRNEDGQWVRPGWSFYTSTAFVMDELADDSMAKVMERFMDDYDENAQLAGLGDFAVKAPDLQLIAYGLLDMDPIAGASRSVLSDRASVLINAINRDIVKSGWFAEVYYAEGAPGEHVGARGVRPSLFGISNYIDFVMMANGVRAGEGDPTFVRLNGATGGVSGLSYLGETLNVDLDGDRVVLSGEAADSMCDAVDIAEGQTVTWAEGCAESEPTDPPADGEGDDSNDDGGSSSDDGTSSGADQASHGESALPRTGADIGAALMVAVALLVIGSLTVIARRRRRGAARR